MSTPRRAYSSRVRADSARETRRRIIAVAGHRFVTDGYAAVSLDAIAAESGVSVQTVYNSVGRKPTLLKAAYDVLLAGDDEPIAIDARQHMQAFRSAPTGRAALHQYAELAVSLYARVGPLVAMAKGQAASGETDLVEFTTTIDQERLRGATGVITDLDRRFGLRPGLARNEAIDVLWTLTGVETQQRLVGDRGWSVDRYRDWLAAAMVDLLLGPECADATPRSG